MKVHSTYGGADELRKGDTLVRPILAGEWRPGMPCHWREQTNSTKWKFLIVRFLNFSQIIAGLAYLNYRVRETIGVLDRTPLHHTYQMVFFVLECISFFSILLRLPESWNVFRRNCVDFKLIPNEMIAAQFFHPSDKNVRPQHSNYPSVGVFIPCYNEDVELIQDTLLGALNLDYPQELLSIYLCDDGKDPAKRSLVKYLQNRHKNVHYMTRSEHKHAKAGNLNASLERTSSDLIVILDADFIARPHLLQRLLPYYFVWNPVIELYEFNETLAAVQAPQQFRNLSPHDSDPTDQRATFFFEIVLPGKDWFNAAPLVGTTNLLNRTALQKAEYFPFHSVTEDTALSIVLHSLGYRTYYVNEPLASGLATTSLWSNFDQRERWLKGDWQILFSKKGPLTAKGLSLTQRLLYLNMGYARFLSIVHLLYDLASVLLLVFGISMVDVVNTWQFIIYLGPFIFLSLFVRWVRTLGGYGLDKSECGADAFETMFRFVSFKSLFVALYKGKKIKFQVTEKERIVRREKAKNVHHRDVLKNLKRIWFNISMACLLSFAIGFGVASPPTLHGRYAENNVLPMAMALGFAAANLLPHLLAVYLCFIPLVSGWVMEDVVHGRCDQYAVDPATGKRFVPSSFISLLNITQACLIFGAMAALVAYTFRDKYAKFVPL